MVDVGPFILQITNLIIDGINVLDTMSLDINGLTFTALDIGIFFIAMYETINFIEYLLWGRYI